MTFKIKECIIHGVAILMLPAAFCVNAEDLSGDFDTGAVMFQHVNYGGTSKFFPEKPGKYTLTGSENDFYHSVKVGKFSKVFAWEDGGTSMAGSYQEWTSDDPDFTDLNGLSNFKVVPNAIVGVSIRLVDGIGTNKKYCMASKVYGAGEGADVYSCTDNPTYQLVGTLNPTAGGESIVASIAVRNMQPGDPNFGSYINNGSVYFKVKDGDISVSHNAGEFDNFPKNLEIIEVSDNRFDVILKSEVPDND